MKQGLFISFEGGEGAGKSTAIATCSNLLDQLGVRHRVTREPGGTPLGNALRAVVLDQRYNGMCAESEVLIMFAARAQHVVETIKPALAAGEWVIADRFTDASFAYQVGGRGIEREVVEALERRFAFGLKPARTFLLDVAVDEGLRRVVQRGAKDRMERESTGFFERVRAAYRDRAASEPGRFCILDASRTVDAVNADLRDEIRKLVEGWRDGE